MFGPNSDEQITLGKLDTMKDQSVIRDDSDWLTPSLRFSHCDLLSTGVDGFIRKHAVTPPLRKAASAVRLSKKHPQENRSSPTPTELPGKHHTR